MSKKKVLVVDDSKTQQIKLQLLLELNSYEVSTALNGVEALEKLSKEPVDLIISDIVMPNMDGFELCEKVKFDERLKAIPVILLTTLDKIEDVIRGLSLGADNYISKPYDNDYLLYRIEHILNNKDIEIQKVDNDTKFKMDIGKESFVFDADAKKILNYFITSYEASILNNRTIVRVKDKLEILNNSLEQRVKKRTQEIETEIQKHKDTLKELEFALMKSQKLDYLKTEFMNNLSHEIRTPMNAIIGFTELINDPGTEDKEVETYLPYIKTSLFSLLNIIDSVMEASEVLSGNVNLDVSDCDIKHMFEDAKKTIADEIISQNKKIQLSYNFPQQMDRKIINTYSINLKNILIKLLTNAIKFSNEGVVKFGVDIIENNFLQFYVKDQGIGIPKEYFNEIFEYFKQLEELHPYKYNGTGVGLAVVKNLVRLMGGKIWLISEIGKGTTFYFTVPYFGELKLKPSLIKKTEKQHKEIEGLTVLVAEDVETNYFLIQSILKKHKTKLHWAKNGKEALTYYKKYHKEIDLILMDIQMPVMNGIEATKIIKKEFPEAQIIALTAFASKYSEKGFIKYGFNSVFSKPFDSRRLVDIIKKSI